VRITGPAAGGITFRLRLGSVTGTQISTTTQERNDSLIFNGNLMTTYAHPGGDLAVLSTVFANTSPPEVRVSSYLHVARISI